MSRPVTPDDDLSGQTLVNEYGAAEILYDAHPPSFPFGSMFAPLPDPGLIATDPEPIQDQSVLGVQVNVRDKRDGAVVSVKAARESRVCVLGFFFSS